MLVLKLSVGKWVSQQCGKNTIASAITVQSVASHTVLSKIEQFVKIFGFSYFMQLSPYVLKLLYNQILQFTYL